MHVHCDNAVATHLVLVGSLIIIRKVVNQSFMVGCYDFVTLGIPKVFVATFLYGNGELVSIERVYGEVEPQKAVAAMLGL